MKKFRPARGDSRPTTTTHTTAQPKVSNPSNAKELAIATQKLRSLVDKNPKKAAAILAEWINSASKKSSKKSVA